MAELVRHEPAFAAQLLMDALHIGLPAFDGVRCDSGELSDLVTTEYRADGVVVLTMAGTAVLAVVVEVQLSPKVLKRWKWPVYLARARARLRCPTMLLVVCADLATARWCGTPIDLGHPGLTLTPLVVGPDRVPVVTEVAAARRSPRWPRSRRSRTAATQSGTRSSTRCSPDSTTRMSSR
jgi:hypothetical protein